MAWYYHLNGENHGPVQATELQGLHQSGVIALDTPVWTEGMAQWEPYQSSPVLTPVSAVATATQACAECGKRFSEDEMLHYENSWVCATCKPIFFQRIKEGVAPAGTFTFASVGKRFVAVFSDGILLKIGLALPVFLIGGTDALIGRTAQLPGAIMAIVLFIQLLVPALYEIIFIGRYGATPGKMLLKVKVVTADGSPMTYGRSTGRYFAKMLSGIILGIGYLMAFWDSEKRALHDRICKTRVVVNNPS